MKNQKILIVDDDDFCREAMERLLNNSGYKTQACSCGDEAIDLLKQEEFDIMITDLQMKGMDGLELIGKAKHIAPRLEFILMTGTPYMNFFNRLEEIKLKGYFSKPLDWKKLSALLE
ncbi:MAG: response regulator [bacterium]